MHVLVVKDHFARGVTTFFQLNTILESSVIHRTFVTRVDLMGWVLRYRMSSSIWDEFFKTLHVSQISSTYHQKVIPEHNCSILEPILSPLVLSKSSRKMFQFGGGLKKTWTQTSRTDKSPRMWNFLIKML